MDTLEKLVASIEKHLEYCETRIAEGYLLYTNKDDDYTGRYYWIARSTDTAVKSCRKTKYKISDLNASIIVHSSSIKGGHRELNFDLTIFRDGKSEYREEQYIHLKDSRTMYKLDDAPTVYEVLDLILSGRVLNIPPEVISDEVKEFYGLPR